MVLSNAYKMYFFLSQIATVLCCCWQVSFCSTLRYFYTYALKKKVFFVNHSGWRKIHHFRLLVERRMRRRGSSKVVSTSKKGVQRGRESSRCSKIRESSVSRIAWKPKIEVLEILIIRTTPNGPPLWNIKNCNCSIFQF